MAALGVHTMATLVVVVDEDVDIFNEPEVLWAMATRVVGDRDISIISEATGQRLNPSAYDETRALNREESRGNMVSKVIIDATKPVDLPFATRITPNKELWQAMQLEDYLK